MKGDKVPRPKQSQPITNLIQRIHFLTRVLKHTLKKKNLLSTRPVTLKSPKPFPYRSRIGFCSVLLLPDSLLFQLFEQGRVVMIPSIF
ncbi:hypothetical protein NC653_037765 [Populus alba x Populus x berolinensis]|uniref:Uncharacterized protein n=1 Tax=Populus alba x Populus x berolinensis TaxID=444605 RepID=A0AAD6LF09_9ROSI|nr:hypothetical protein NC653_037765 [Populus alba x Populus x berolinensis]